MINLLEIFLQIVFTALCIGSVVILVFVVIADAVGWFDSRGHYIGPFSKRK